MSADTTKCAICSRAIVGMDTFYIHDNKDYCADCWYRFDMRAEAKRLAEMRARVDACRKEPQ